MTVALSMLAWVARKETRTEKPPVPVDARRMPGAELVGRISDHIRKDQVEALRMYLEAGYSPNAVNARGDSLLILAAYLGKKEIMGELLAQPGVDIDFRNKMGFTALAGAAFKGHTEIMEQLIGAGADVNAISPGGRTALMFAALTGRTEAAKLLLRRGADPAAKDGAGMSAADVAQGQGADETAALLKVSPARR